MLDTMVHNKTAFLANVAQEIRARETTLGIDHGVEEGRRVVFKRPRIVDYRASVHDIANYLMDLMTDQALRQRMGAAGRQRVVTTYDYRVVARRFARTVKDRLGIA